MNNYCYKRISDDLISKLVPLYKNALDMELSKERIKNKFDTCQYSGKKYIAFLALDENEEAVALYAIFPAVIHCNGSNYICGQVGDLMTHSEHRRKGLFIKLAELTHELAKNEGIKLIFTFPFGHNASYKGFVEHLGFFHAESMRSYVIKVNTFPLCRLSYKNNLGIYIYNLYVKSIMRFFYSRKYSFDKNFQYKNGYVVKDENFFDYKFSYSPGFLIRLSGMSGWIKFTKFGSVSVGDFEQYTNLGKDILQLKRFCFWTGIRAIQIETSHGTELDIFLKDKYLFLNNYHVCMLKLDSDIPFEKFKFVFGDMDNF